MTQSIYEAYYSEANGEVALWRAVLVQAFFDLADRGILSRSRSKEQAEAVSAAREWFFGEDQEPFQAVCSAAQVDPERVKRFAGKIDDRNSEAINALLRIHRAISMRPPRDVFTALWETV